MGKDTWQGHSAAAPLPINYFKFDVQLGQRVALNEETILPNAPPMMTPAARPMTVPRMAKALNTLSLTSLLFFSERWLGTSLYRQGRGLSTKEALCCIILA